MKLITVNVDMTEEGKGVFKLIGGFELAFGSLLDTEQYLASNLRGALQEQLNMQVKQGKRSQKVANKIVKDRMDKFETKLIKTKQVLKEFLDSMDTLREANEEVADIVKENLYNAADETFNITPINKVNA